MKSEVWKEILATPPYNPSFYARCYLKMVEAEEGQFLSDLWDLKSETTLSFLMDQSEVQDSFSFRAQRRALRIAFFLIDEKGEFKEELLDPLIKALETKGYVHYPQGVSDGSLTRHMILCLKKFQEKKVLQKQLKKFQNPLCHKWAERIIRDTVGVGSNTPLTDREIRVAVLATCLTLLRQSIGSCFATAPAILIQSEQLENLLADLYELLSTGKLKRVFGGVEFSVPLSPSTGGGDLKKSIALENPDARISLSPGLLAALEKGGVLPSSGSLDKKFSELEKLVAPFLLRKEKITIEQFLKEVLLHYFGLDKEEIENLEKYELSLVKQSRQTAVLQFAKGSSKKREDYLRFLDAEREAKTAFKALTDNFLLKAWEFTLASFSEVKMEFSRWNLYSGLGLNPEEEGGLGKIIYRFTEEKVETSNEKLESYQRDYQEAFDQLRAVEVLLKRASSESEARRLKAEFQSRLYHMQACLDIRDRFYKRATHYTNFFSFLTKQYDQKFQEYFQEIYDAEMQDVDVHQYDDSPAGFRLVYKHGRSDASLWTMIYSSEQYIDALIDFFSSVESQIIAACDWEKAENDIKEITSALITHLRSETFLQTAFLRMAKAHKVAVRDVSLSSLQKMEKKPWAYTSGGTMSTLLKTYYRREGELTEESARVQNELDLLTFLLDTLKNLPFSLSELYSKDPDRGMLMYSPSHAFVLYPGWDLLQKGWEDSGFTYTWIRDAFIQPRQRFYAGLLLSRTEQDTLLELFITKMPPDIAYLVRKAYEMTEDPVSIKEFRLKVLKAFQNLPKKKFFLDKTEDLLDSLLYQSLPLIPGSRWKAYVYQILDKKVGKKLLSLLDQLPDESHLELTSKTLQEMTKACFILSGESCSSDFDLHEYVAKRMQELKLASPKPLVFADTNWSHYDFAFVINPGTEELQLWRVMHHGLEGIKMRSWDPWLKGAGHLPWGLYIRPQEYGVIAERKL